MSDRLAVAFTIALGLAVCLVADGCKRKPAALLFHAGAGQRSSLDEIAVVFAARNPGVRVDFSYKGSGFFTRAGKHGTSMVVQYCTHLAHPVFPGSISARVGH